MSVGAGGGLLAAVRSGRVCRLCSLWAAGSSVRRWRCCWCRSASGWRCGWAGGSAAAAGGVHMMSGGDIAGLLIRQAGQAGRRRKRKRPGQTARRALLLWPLVCTGGNGSGGVRPGAGGGADLLAVPVGMVSAGTVPAVGVPASRLALAVLHPGQFCRLPEGSDSPPNGIERQV